MNLTTCLWFNGQARQAAQFYTSIFPNSSMGSNWIAPTETPGNEQGDEVYVDFTIFGQPLYKPPPLLNYRALKRHLTTNPQHTDKTLTIQQPKSSY